MMKETFLDLNSRVKDLMSYGVETVSLTTTVTTAAKLMQTETRACLPVVDNGKLCGIVTQQDLATRGILSAKSPHRTTVKEIMTNYVITCSPSDYLVDALLLLDRNEIRQLVVVDDQTRPIATLSIDDYFIYSLANQELITLGKVIPLKQEA
jgi:CBS domain-containing protein